MSVKITQVAIGVRKGSENYVSEIKNLLGAVDWIFDTVKFSGSVFGEKTESTEAKLNFNYDLIPGVEFEILEYTDGINWHEDRGSIYSNLPFISHLGLHIDDWEEFCSLRNRLVASGCDIAQSADTFEHSNPDVPDTRRYHYLIMNTIHLFGFDLKLIYRKEVGQNDS
jgi:hypothetical protein